MVLEQVCEYLCYNLKYKDQTDVADFDISPEMSLELLMAADYLDGKLSRFLQKASLTSFSLTNIQLIISFIDSSIPFNSV